MANIRHSVALTLEKCKGCTHCLQRCPTEAIRIRDGHAQITTTLCIDCGECIRTCTYQAKRAEYDPFECIQDYKYKIALPAPALYGQFDHLDDINYVLEGLLKIGFDDLFEVAQAAELVSGYSQRYLQREDVKKPVISSACPVIGRLISIRYPDLVANVLPLHPPVDMAAKLARIVALKEHPELKEEDIGVFFISPCPAKVSYLKDEAEKGRQLVDGVLSMGDVYKRLVQVMKREEKPQPRSRTGCIGIRWAGSGGEAKALSKHRHLAASGIENVIRVLDSIDNDTLPDLDFIELNACPGGCVGGVLAVENPFVARSRLLYVEKNMPQAVNWDFSKKPTNTFVPGDYFLEEQLTYDPPQALDDDRRQALVKRMQIERLVNELPSLDCGACGAPTCRALAEDIVRGLATHDDCLMLGKFRQVNKERSV
ncbi:MAG: ferredoxin [Clostridia bacterium]|nr:ferredoxin [Clostridia bacterium]MBR1703971.1 ferredoxin [Clostridia bacterium]